MSYCRTLLKLTSHTQLDHSVWQIINFGLWPITVTVNEMDLEGFIYYMLTKQ